MPLLPDVPLLPRESSLRFAWTARREKFRQRAALATRLWPTPPRSHLVDPEHQLPQFDLRDRSPVPQPGLPFFLLAVQLTPGVTAADPQRGPPHGDDRLSDCEQPNPVSQLL